MRVATRKKDRPPLPELRLVRGRKNSDAPDAWRKHPEYGMCRTITGHAWDRGKQALQLQKDDVIVRMSCEHCGKGKRYTVSYRTGMVTSKPAYTDPEGYRLSYGGGPRPGKSDLRRAFLHLMFAR